jgi:hypothetical protein
MRACYIIINPSPFTDAAAVTITICIARNTGVAALYIIIAITKQQYRLMPLANLIKSVQKLKRPTQPTTVGVKQIFIQLFTVVSFEPNLRVIKLHESHQLQLMMFKQARQQKSTTSPHVTTQPAADNRC